MYFILIRVVLDMFLNNLQHVLGVTTVLLIIFFCIYYPYMFCLHSRCLTLELLLSFPLVYQFGWYAYLSSFGTRSAVIPLGFWSVIVLFLICWEWLTLVESAPFTIFTTTWSMSHYITKWLVVLSVLCFFPEIFHLFLIDATSNLIYLQHMQNTHRIQQNDLSKWIFSLF